MDRRRSPFPNAVDDLSRKSGLIEIDMAKSILKRTPGIAAFDDILSNVETISRSSDDRLVGRCRQSASELGKR